MQRIFSLLICNFICLICLSQNQNTNLNSNNNTLEPVVLDTVSFFEKASGTAPAPRKKYETTIKSKGLNVAEPASPMQDAEMVVDTQKSTLNLMSVQFNSNFQSASRQFTRRSATPFEQNRMDESVGLMRTIAPESFETNFFGYLAGHYDTTRFDQLQKAATLAPTNPEVQKNLFAHFVITNQLEKADSIVFQLINDSVYSAGQMTYGSDLLNSVVPNGTLILHGFDDFVPTFYANSTFTNSAVTLVSLDFLQSETYRNNLSTNGYVLPQKSTIDTAYLQQFCLLNAHKNIQLSATLPKDYLSGFAPQLFPLGLTFAIHSKTAETFAWNNELWQTKWNQKQLMNGTTDFVERWSGNYLPALIELRKQHEILGHKEDVEALNRVILAIAARRNQTKLVKKTMN